MTSIEKKIQENPLPEEHQHPDSTDKDMTKGTEKTQVPSASPPLEPVTMARVAIPSFTKTPPNELYRRLLPAVLFLLTFVTVMTMLLIYMDTVALGARQFRANMSRDYELARIPQESSALGAAGAEATFRSRVLCLPLYTVLLAAEATAAQYLLLPDGRPLTLLPYDKVALQVIELRTTDQKARNATTQFLLTKNYTVAATFEDGIMYALNRDQESNPGDPSDVMVDASA
ncbi:hypothetical protein ACJJTC_005226 [Scirpophaga incertulas]